VKYACLEDSHDMTATDRGGRDESLHIEREIVGLVVMGRKEFGRDGRLGGWG
jgi:hypothetical protein